MSEEQPTTPGLSQDSNRHPHDFKTLEVRRKAMEEELRSKTYLLAKAQELGRIGTWEMDLTNNILVWTDEAYELFGLPSGTPLTYETFLDCVHPDDRAYVDQEWSTRMLTNDYDIEHRLMRDGQVRWVREKADITYDKDGKPLTAVGFTQDITHIKHAESALRAERDRANRYLDIAPAIILSLDRDGRVTLLNQAGGRILGCSPSDAKGKNWFDTFIPQRLRDEMRPVFDQLMEGTLESLEDYENPVITATGGERLISWHNTLLRDEHGNTNGIISSGQDITDRRKAEDTLLQSYNYLESLYAAVGEAIFCVRLPDRIIEGCNPMTESIFGFTREQLIGQPTRILYADQTGFENFGRALEDAINQRKERLTIEHELRRADGRTFPAEVTTSFVAEGRDILRVITVVRDVSERRQLEARVREAEKIEAIGRLAGGIAHDFNNLLMGIMNYVDLCRDDLESGHPVHKWLDEVMTGAKRSANLTRQLLAFGRRQQIAPVILDLNTTVTGMLGLLRRLIGEAIDLAWEPGADLWPVKMDPSQVDQILTNLSVNARDAIDGVGKIVIETENIALDSTYCTDHLGAVPGDYVTLSVSDTGCGMAPDAMERAFEPFFTTKSVGKGTGLGLATVHGIATQNGGHVAIYSEPNAGTTIRVYLPRAAGDISCNNDEAQSTKSSGGSETILFVEDEASILTTCRTFLSALGYTVLATDRPIKARQLAAEHPGRIQLLITDIVMPDMNGKALADSLKDEDPELKTLYISGYTAGIIAEHGISDEDTDFLSKPFNREVLAQKVREILDR